MAKVINPDAGVFYTGKGRHFHLFEDCRGLWQGRTNSLKYNRELHGEADLTYEGAIHMDLYGCEFCHKRIGMAVPAECSLRVARERNAAKRAARKAEREAVAAAKANPIVETAAPVVHEIADLDVATIESLIAQLQSMLVTAAA